MAEEKSTAAERGAMGGDARAAKLPTEQRTQIARKAAEARWGADLPQASHDGPLKLGDTVLVAAVLPNGRRLLSQGTFLQAIGRARTAKSGTGGLTGDGLPSFLQADQLKSFISEDIRLATTPILFRLKSGQRTVGYDANLLHMVCGVYQKLHRSLTDRMHGDDERDAARAKGIYGQYKHIIAACDALMNAFGQRGIEALVDDATGYRADQTKEDVLRVIAKYMSPRLVTLTKRFPPEFFQEIYRLHGWEYKPGSIHHPQYTGKLITKYVYEPLPPGVLEEMKERLPKNENGNRRSQLWRTLSIDTGIPHLDRQIADVLLMMRLSDSKDEFDQKFERIFGKQLQLRLQLLEEFKELTS